MRRFALLCPAILIAGSVFAMQDPATAPPAQDPVTGKPAQSGDANRMKMKAVNISGTVKSYEPGKSIEVDAKGTPHTYDLTSADMTVTVGADVKVGSKVKVAEKPDSSGKKTVTINTSGGTN